MEPLNYCLKWKKQREHFQNTLVKYIDHQLLCDVTIASDGEVLKAHQFVLSACSSYFENIFSTVPNNKHPIIFLKDITSLELKTLIDYMYKGEAVVSSDLLPSFLKTCEYLKINGLCEETYANQESEDNINNNTRDSREKTLKETPTLSNITDSGQKSIPSSRKRNGLLLLANDSQKKKRKKRIGNASQKSPSSQENNESCSELIQTNENQMHDQTKGKSLVSKQQLQENKINYTISKEAGPTELFLNKSIHLEENVHLPATNSIHITQDINQSVNKEIVQGSILDSPVYTQTQSFIFNVNEDLSKSPNHPVSPSFQCLIIDDFMPEVVEISDNEDCGGNVKMPVLGCSQNSVDCSAVPLDAEIQKGISKDVDLNNAHDSESDDSEITSPFSYFTRNRVPTELNLSDDNDSSIYSQETEPNQKTSVNTENCKNEARKRAQSMKVVIAKESYSHFEKNISGRKTNQTSSPEISNLDLTVNPEKQNKTTHIFRTKSSNKDDQQLVLQTGKISTKTQASISKVEDEKNVKSASDSPEKNQWFKSLNLVKKGVEKNAKEKLPQKIRKRQLRPRTPKPSKKES